MSKHKTDYESGDLVIVEGLDGEEGLAMVVDVAAKPAGEYVLFGDEPGETATTVKGYWGHQVSEGEPVIDVRYAHLTDDDMDDPVLEPEVYGFPASKVREYHEGEEDVL